jgi:hypothetical protein
MIERKGERENKKLYNQQYLIEDVMTTLYVLFNTFIFLPP